MLGPAIGASGDPEADSTEGRTFMLTDRKYSITASETEPSARDFVEWTDMCQRWPVGL